MKRVRNLCLFALICGHLLLSVSLTGWRYSLILRGEADIFVTPLNEHTDELARLALEECPPTATMALVTSASGHLSSLRYWLYPRQVTEYDTLGRDDAECIIVMGEMKTDIIGRRVVVADDAYLIIREKQ